MTSDKKTKGACPFGMPPSRCPARASYGVTFICSVTRGTADGRVACDDLDAGARHVPDQVAIRQPTRVVERRLPEVHGPDVGRERVVGADENARAGRRVAATVVDELRHRRTVRVEVHDAVAGAVVGREQLRLGREAERERRSGRTGARALRVERMRVLAARIDPKPGSPVAEAHTGALAVVARAAAAPVVQTVRVVGAEDVPVRDRSRSPWARRCRRRRGRPRGLEDERRAAARRSGGAAARGVVRRRINRLDRRWRAVPRRSPRPVVHGITGAGRVGGEGGIARVGRGGVAGMCSWCRRRLVPGRPAVARTAGNGIVAGARARRGRGLSLLEQAVMARTATSAAARRMRSM